MGFDDVFFSEFCNPSLTTVALEKYDWGRTLMKFTIDRLENPTDNNVDFKMPNELLSIIILTNNY